MKTVCTVLFGLVCTFTSLAIAEDRRYTIPLGDSPRSGPDDARVTMVEFIDFQ